MRQLNKWWKNKTLKIIGALEGMGSQSNGLGILLILEN